jgi:hypothetical protein
VAQGVQLRRCQQVPHELRRHPTIGRLSWADFGLYVELRGIADSAHPSAGLLPRSIGDELLEPLVAQGAIIREDEHHFRCPELDEDREAVSAFFRAARQRVKGKRGPDGRYTKGAERSTEPDGAATKPLGQSTNDRTGRDGQSYVLSTSAAASAPDGRAALDETSLADRLLANGVKPELVGDVAAAGWTQEADPPARSDSDPTPHAREDPDDPTPPWVRRPAAPGP